MTDPQIIRDEHGNITRIIDTITTKKGDQEVEYVCITRRRVNEFLHMADARRENARWFEKGPTQRIILAEAAVLGGAAFALGLKT